MMLIYTRILKCYSRRRRQQTLALVPKLINKVMAYEHRQSNSQEFGTVLLGVTITITM